MRRKLHYLVSLTRSNYLSQGASTQRKNGGIILWLWCLPAHRVNFHPPSVQDRGHAERTSNHLLVRIEAGRMCHPQKTWDGVGLLTAAPFFPGPASYGPPICPFIFSLHLGRLVGLRCHMSEAGRAAASPPGRSLLDQPVHIHRGLLHPPCAGHTRLRETRNGHYPACTV